MSDTNLTEEPPLEFIPEPVIPEELPAPEYEPTDTGLTAVQQRELAQQAETDNKVVVIKSELQVAADKLFTMQYTNAAWRVVDALTFIEAQQARQGKVT